ncbi:MAG: NADH-quinone oxidoreductase subunit L [Anaerolineae bacterium]|nr:NADH-quinone oxidoreductase subunit L [Anaerolineae bacterium]
MSILNVAWLIPLFPFLAFVAIALYAHRDQVLSHRLAVGGIAGAFLLAQIAFWAFVLGHHAGVPFQASGIKWLFLGEQVFMLGLYIDPATAIMLFMVPLVCLMIFIYSVGYMQGDPRYSRFFAYISLFATGMLGLVVFDNLLTFFIFWEIMGTCSYLLIGFWYEKPSAFAAGLKAFLVTKVGDLFFILGLVVLYAEVGSLAYRDLFSVATLQHLAQPGYLGLPVAPATVIALLLFGGTMGKSAQFPLHTWLPDAMEGPTPVSALIHAATMVSAGVFLVVRAYPLFTAVPGVQLPFVTVIGAVTAMLGALIAVAQDDIKRVLAFSTISQLGYMVAALGTGAYVAGVFHLVTHAFFKALLFLSSGSVLHGMEHAHHHVIGESHTAQSAFDPNDMLSMGGLGKRMPRTAIAFLVGGLALSGFPVFTAGFWSKDEILAQTYVSNPPVFGVLAAAAALTAFYTARQLSLTFLGEPRSKAAAHAKESGDSMTIPLLILAGFSVVLGWVGIPEHFPLLGGLIPNWFEHFMGASLEMGPGPAHEAALAFAWQPLVVGLSVALGGLGAGYLVYGRRPLQSGEPDRVLQAFRAVKMGWVYRALQQRLYFDQLYQATFVKGSIVLARIASWLDRAVIDGSVLRAASLVRAVSGFVAWLDRVIVDALVDLVGRGARVTARALTWFDTHVVDSVVNVASWLGRLGAMASGFTDDAVLDNLSGGVAGLVGNLGRALRTVQTGRVQDYLWLALLAILALAIVFFIPF